MNKPRKDKEKKEDVDLRPDGWGRFESAVDAAVKSGPKHRPSKVEKKKRESDKK